MYVGLITQADQNEDVGCFPDYGQGFTRAHASQVREVRLHWCRARGPCYARYLAQKLYKGERYHPPFNSVRCSNFRISSDEGKVQFSHPLDASRRFLAASSWLFEAVLI